MARYECTEDNHNKFWEYEGPTPTNTREFSVSVRWGRIGWPTSQSQTKTFSVPSDALRFIEDKVSEKLGKGYRQVRTSSTQGARLPASMSEVWYDEGVDDERTKSGKPQAPKPKVKEGIDVIDFDLIAEPGHKK